MSVRHPVKRLFVLVLVAAAVVVGSQLGGPLAARASGGSTSSIANGDGNPSAVPPILAPATPSELAALRREEAWEAAAFYYDPPASARYSVAALNGYSNTAR